MPDERSILRDLRMQRAAGIITRGMVAFAGVYLAALLWVILFVDTIGVRRYTFAAFGRPVLIGLGVIVIALWLWLDRGAASLFNWLFGGAFAALVLLLMMLVPVSLFNAYVGERRDEVVPSRVEEIRRVSGGRYRTLVLRTIEGRERIPHEVPLHVADDYRPGQRVDLRMRRGSLGLLYRRGLPKRVPPPHQG